MIELLKGSHTFTQGTPELKKEKTLYYQCNNNSEFLGTMDNATSNCIITYPFYPAHHNLIPDHKDVWYYPQTIHSTGFIFDHSLLNVEKAENGFILKYQKKNWIASNSEELSKIIESILNDKTENK